MRRAGAQCLEQFAAPRRPFTAAERAAIGARVDSLTQATRDGCAAAAQEAQHAEAALQDAAQRLAAHSATTPADVTAWVRQRADLTHELAGYQALADRAAQALATAQAAHDRAREVAWVREVRAAHAALAEAQASGRALVDQARAALVDAEAQARALELAAHTRIGQVEAARSETR